MVTILTNIAVFGSFFTSFLLHLKSRQSKSYLLLLGYLTGCLIIVTQVAKFQSPLPFGIWGIPLVLLGLGEVLRFFLVEREVSTLVNSLLDRTAINSISFKVIKEASTYVSYLLSKEVTVQGSILSTENSLQTILSVKSNYSFRAFDFDGVLKVTSGDAYFIVKGVKHDSPTRFSCSDEVFIITQSPTVVIELLATKRHD